MTNCQGGCSEDSSPIVPRVPENLHVDVKAPDCKMLVFPLELLQLQENICFLLLSLVSCPPPLLIISSEIWMLADSFIKYLLSLYYTAGIH